MQISLMRMLSEFVLTSGTVTVSLTPQSMIASVGQKLEFTCNISDLPPDHHLDNYDIGISTNTQPSDLKQINTSDNSDGVNSKKVMFTLKQPMQDEARVCCTVTNKIDESYYINCTTFLVQGIYSVQYY